MVEYRLYPDRALCRDFLRNVDKFDSLVKQVRPAPAAVAAKSLIPLRQPGCCFGMHFAIGDSSGAMPVAAATVRQKVGVS